MYKDPRSYGRNFVIPRKKKSVPGGAESGELLRSLSLDSREFHQDIENVLTSNCYVDPKASGLTFTKCTLVQNKTLTKKLDDRKRELKQSGYVDNNLHISYAFGQVYSDKQAELICSQGLRVGNSVEGLLGDATKGVYLSRYVDVLSAAPLTDGCSGIVIVYKVIKGKTKIVSPWSDLDPTLEFDSHVPRPPATSPKNWSSRELYDSSRVYFYDYAGKFALETNEYPRNVCPYAVLHWTVSSSNSERNFMEHVCWRGQVRCGKTTVSAVSMQCSYTKLKPFGLSSSLKIEKLVPFENCYEFEPFKELMYGHGTKFGAIFTQREVRLRYSINAAYFRLSSTAPEFIKLAQEMRESRVVGAVSLLGGTSLLVFPSSEVSSAIGIPFLSESSHTYLHILAVSYRSFTAGLEFIGKDPFEVRENEPPALSALVRADCQKVIEMFKALHPTPVIVPTEAMDVPDNMRPCDPRTIRNQIQQQTSVSSQDNDTSRDNEDDNTLARFSPSPGADIEMNDHVAPVTAEMRSGGWKVLVTRPRHKEKSETEPKPNEPAPRSPEPQKSTTVAQLLDAIPVVPLEDKRTDAEPEAKKARLTSDDSKATDEAGLVSHLHTGIYGFLENLRMLNKDAPPPVAVPETPASPPPSTSAENQSAPSPVLISTEDEPMSSVVAPEPVVIVPQESVTIQEPHVTSTCESPSDTGSAPIDSKDTDLRQKPSDPFGLLSTPAPSFDSLLVSMKKDVDYRVGRPVVSKEAEPVVKLPEKKERKVVGGGWRKLGSNYSAEQGVQDMSIDTDDELKQPPLPPAAPKQPSPPPPPRSPSPVDPLFKSQMLALRQRGAFAHADAQAETLAQFLLHQSWNNREAGTMLCEPYNRQHYITLSGPSFGFDEDLVSSESGQPQRMHEGIMVPDDMVLYRADAQNLQRILEYFAVCRQTGRANWVFKLHSQVVLSLAQSRKNLDQGSSVSIRLGEIISHLTNYRRLNVVELLPNHQCDWKTRRAVEYLPCILGMKQKSTPDAELIFLTNLAPGCDTAQAFWKADISVMNIQTFIDTHMSDD